MNSKVNSTFRETMNKSSQVTANALHDELLQTRFIIQSHNKQKLKQSLSLTKDYELIDKTLLTESIHKTHAKSLHERYLKQLNSKTKKKYKFLTLLHSVEILSQDRILKAVEEMRYMIHQVVSESKSIQCLGSIEVEIVSIRLMKEIQERDKFNDSEHRKLNVLEELSKRLRKKSERESESLALIHFHAVVTSTSEYYFNKFLQKLKSISIWKKTKRQIELKNLSTFYSGKEKSLKENLKDIATYITKGGNDWYGKKAYLRYKIGFDNESYESEDSWVLKNIRRNKILKQEQKEEGIEDILSLNRFEISTLANVIYKIMSHARDNKGYLINAKSGSYSRKIYENYLKNNTKISTTLFDISTN